MRFSEIHVMGFRKLVDAVLPLHPLNVMIGPNGSGKTSVLDIFQLLRDAMQEKLSEVLERLGGLNAVLSRLPEDAERLWVELQIDVESSQSDAPMCYRFEISQREVGYQISREQLEWQYDRSASKPFLYIDAHAGNVLYADPEVQRSFVRPTWQYHHTELALAQIPRMYAEPETLRNTLSRTRIFSFLDVRPRSVVRLPQALTPTTSPGPNGENLYSSLYNLRTGHPDSYERIEQVLRLGFPGFQRIDFPVVGAGQVALAWYQDNMTRPLYAAELSEGTLRFLWLATLLLSPEISPITLIDEPEVSLHPELLKLIAELLQDASCRSQLIVATHSADLVRWLEPDEVVVLDQTDHGVSFTRANELSNVQAWLREYTLGDLWLMGTLGGRP